MAGVWGAPGRAHVPARRMAKRRLGIIRCVNPLPDTPTAPEPRPAVRVAVLMRRVPVTGAAARWQAWRWQLDDVVLQQPQHGETPHRLYDNDSGQCWIFPGFTVQLFRDDAEGYALNADTPAPGWFVLWRLPEGADEQTPPEPQAVSLSYHDAGRWLDAQETVEQVPAPPEVVAWMRAFAEQHYQPEPKRRQRPQSFQSLQDRFGNPARVSSQEKRRGGGGGEGGHGGA